MQKQADIVFQNNVFSLTGDLDFCNVMSVYQKGLHSMMQCKELIFDFSAVTSSNSAGIALVIEWVRLAKRSNKPIQFRHFTSDLLSVMQTAGMTALVK
jgi:phospholipid transport system transporter-binding protein